MNINTTSSIKWVRTTNLQHPLGAFQEGSPAITETFNRSFTHLFAVLHHINSCQFYAINYGRNPSVEVERERESLSRYFFSVCIFLRLTLSFCCIHGLDIASTRSKMEDVQQHPYKVYKCSLAQFVVVELMQDVQD